MPYYPLGRFRSNQGFPRKTEFKKVVNFFDRVRFVGGSGTIEIHDGAIYAHNGSVTHPPYSFTEDIDTGMYHAADDRIGFTTGGVRTWLMELVNTDQSRLIPYDNTGNFYDTYLEYDSSNAQWAIDINGATELVLGATTFIVPNVYNVQAGTANVSVASGGALTRISSALRYKKNVKKEGLGLEDIVLTPITYTEKSTDVKRIGLAADWLAEQDERFGVFNDEGIIEDYDNRAVLAVMAAKINRLEDRLDKLEQN